ncbi:MAG TPA: hypothetical protein VFQ85_14730 [Mycobacteriales bacterium]|jgi:hypothetical protein|nr:hypothetical protein [Mycobacteriales bacterium]
MDYTRTTPPEPTLGAELRSSALLFGMAIACTAGAVGVTQLALRVFG